MGRRLETMRQREKRQSEKDDLIRGKKLKIGKEDRKICIVVEESESESKSKSKVKDRISLLVDDILIHILSLLTIKEAQKTSVLSRRWKYLWTHRTCLDFYLDFTKYYDPREEKKFVNWVNEVLSSIQSPTIDHFIVHSSYVSHDVVTLDEWVDFATRKGVKNLELSMMDSSGHFSRGYFSSRPVLSGLKQLRSLVLKDINISGEDLQHFLLHCLSLEKLSIEGSIYLITLKIKGNPLHNLKMLKIFNNLYLEDLQICAPLPKLSSFQFQGLHRTHIYIASAPLLSHMYIGGCNGYDISYITGPFGQLSTQLSQIKTLELTLKTLYPRLVHQFPPSFKLSSLRELTVTVSTTQETYQRLCLLYSLLKSSPFLHKLKVEIQLLLRYDELLIIRVEEEEEEEEEEEDALWTHQHLKVLEVAKFSENPVIVNFVKHIYRAAAHILEKIVIDPMPLHTHTTLLPSPTRILYTDHFEELFEEELITPPINQRIEFIL